MKALLFLSLLVFVSTSFADDLSYPRIGGIERDNQGWIEDYFIDGPSAYCESHSKHLPSIKELAIEATRRGAKMMSWDGGCCNVVSENWTLIQAGKDSFLYDRTNYKKPDGELGGYSFQSSNENEQLTVQSNSGKWQLDGATGKIFYAGGGAVRCAENKPDGNYAKQPPSGNPPAFEGQYKCVVTDHVACDDPVVGCYSGEYEYSPLNVEIIRAGNGLKFKADINSSTQKKIFVNSNWAESPVLGCHNGNFRLNDKTGNLDAVGRSLQSGICDESIIAASTFVGQSGYLFFSIQKKNRLGTLEIDYLDSDQTVRLSCAPNPSVFSPASWVSTKNFFQSHDSNQISGSFYALKYQAFPGYFKTISYPTPSLRSIQDLRMCDYPHDKTKNHDYTCVEINQDLNGKFLRLVRTHSDQNGELNTDYVPQWPRIGKGLPEEYHSKGETILRTKYLDEMAYANAANVIGMAINLRRPVYVIKNQNTVSLGVKKNHLFEIPLAQ